MKLALGTVQLGMNYGIQRNKQPNSIQALDILKTAYRHGINTFDTAPSYGIAENILGQFTNQMDIDKESLNIISKFSPTDNIESDIFLSIKSVGVQYLGGFLSHDANFLLLNPSKVRELNKLKEKGLTKKIGVSIYTTVQAMKALEYDAIDIVQVPYNIFDRRLDECGFFQQAKEKGKEIHARSALLQGLLMMDPEKLPSHMDFTISYLKKFKYSCEMINLAPFDVAVQYVLQHDLIDYLVFGVDNIQQLKEYININLEKISTDIRYEFRSLFSEVEERLVMPNLW